MDKINEFFGKFFEKMQSNPALAGLFIAGVGVILLIAVIMDADWMLEANKNGRFNIGTIVSIWGRTVGRVVMGIISAVIIACGLAFYFLY